MTMNGDDDIDKWGVKVSVRQVIETMVMINGVSGIIIYPQRIEIHVSDVKTKEKIEKKAKELLKDISEYEILVLN